MRLCKLTRRDGSPVYVNPAQVISVEPHALFETPEGKTRLELVGTGSKVYFALAGLVEQDGPTTETEPYWNVVTEPPATVAGLFLSPCGGDAS